MDIKEKLQAATTMRQLDQLRPEVASEMSLDDEKKFNDIQRAFIRAKARIKRTPLNERGEDFY